MKLFFKVKADEQQVPKSPFKVTVVPGPFVDPTKVLAIKKYIFMSKLYFICKFVGIYIETITKVKVYGPAVEGPVRSSQPTNFIVDAKEAGPGALKN